MWSDWKTSHQMLQLLALNAGSGAKTSEMGVKGADRREIGSALLKLFAVVTAFLGFLPVGNPFECVHNLKFRLVGVFALISVFQLVYPILYNLNMMVKYASAPGKRRLAEQFKNFTLTVSTAAAGGRTVDGENGKKLNKPRFFEQFEMVQDWFSEYEAIGDWYLLALLVLYVGSLIQAICHIMFRWASFSGSNGLLMECVSTILLLAFIGEFVKNEVISRLFGLSFDKRGADLRIFWLKQGNRQQARSQKIDDKNQGL